MTFLVKQCQALRKKLKNFLMLHLREDGVSSDSDGNMVIIENKNIP